MVHPGCCLMSGSVWPFLFIQLQYVPNRSRQLRPFSGPRTVPYCHGKAPPPKKPPEFSSGNDMLVRRQLFRMTMEVKNGAQGSCPEH